MWAWFPATNGLSRLDRVNAPPTTPRSSWKLVRDDSKPVDLRLARKEVSGLSLLHQSRGHLSVQMCVDAGFVVERIENGEPGRPLLNGEPRLGAGLGVDQGQGRPQELGDVLLLAGLRLERNIERVFAQEVLLVPA